MSHCLKIHKDSPVSYFSQFLAWETLYKYKRYQSIFGPIWFVWTEQVVTPRPFVHLPGMHHWPQTCWPNRAAKLDKNTKHEVKWYTIQNAGGNLKLFGSLACPASDLTINLYKPMQKNNRTKYTNSGWSRSPSNCAVCMLTYLIFVLFCTPTHFEAFENCTPKKCVNSRQKLPRDKTA